MQRAVLTVNVVAIVGCLVTAAAITWTWHRVREIPRIELGTQLASETETEGTAQNYLIVGTDSADGLAADDPINRGRPPGVRTDTIMLLRLDPRSQQAALVSFPRDLFVRIAGTRGSARINSAFDEGPSRLVATITDAFDLPIHHYLELDFGGFRDLVAAVDGIPVFFPEPVRDRHSGLSVPQAGCVNLDPGQALAYARARTYEVNRGGRWVTDPTGDLGRISRQQDFIRRALRRAFQRGARSPAVLRDLIEVGTGAVTLDATLTPSDLLEVGNRFRSFDPTNLVTYALPVSDAVVQGQQVLRLDNARAQAIFDVFRGADPSVAAPDNTVVVVENGTGASDVATTAAGDLRRLGFVVPPDNVRDAEDFGVAQTVVRYRSGAEARAALVVQALNADPILEESRAPVGGDVAIVIGADWPGVGTTMRPLTPGLFATTSTTAPGSTTATTERPTTTTIVGEVPTAPAGTDC